MFLSADHLVVQYGVDGEIAKFFVDRDPPANNLYWKDKLLYLRFDTGYIFIPLIADILFKLGIEKKAILSEKFVGLMEAVGHISALEEFNHITGSEALHQCAEAAKKASINNELLFQVNEYFTSNHNPYPQIQTPFTALHPGDAFLYCLTALPIDRGKYEEVIQYWFALITTLLLLDDAQDFRSDEKNNEPNAFLQAGLHKDGIEQLKRLVQSNFILLSKINTTLAKKLDKQVVYLFQQHFQHLLN